MAINSPGRRDDAWDKVAKALSIVSQGIGIAGHVQGMVHNAEGADHKRQALANEREGIITPEAYVKLQTSHKESDQASPGAIGLKVPTPNSPDKQPYKTVYFSPKDAAKSGMSPYEAAKLRADGFVDASEKDKDAKPYQIAGQEKPVYLAYRPKLDPGKAPNVNKEIYERLPPENKEMIKDLAKATAGKIDITNHINSALEILKDPRVSEEQKVVAGENLLKTLNSAEGKDAVGAEESKRLGSFLQYKMANFTGPGSFIGRDLDKFTDQVALKAQELTQSAERNQARIDQLYGRNSREINGLTIPTTAMKKQKPSELVNSAQAANKPPKGKVRVSNGKETFNIAPGDVPAAMKDGFKVIE
jgi:hypothetical protein